MGVLNEFISNIKKSESRLTKKVKYPLDFKHGGLTVDSKKSHRFFNEFRELLYGMFLTGRFPFTRDAQGNVKYSMLSLSFLYWMIWYCSVGYAVIGVMSDSFKSLFASPRFDAAVGHLRKIIILLNLILVPLSHLGEWKKLAHYVNEWDDFLVTYKYMAGHDLRIKLKVWIYMVLTVTPLAGLLATFTEQENLGIKNNVQRVMMMMLFSGTAFVSMFWIMCHVVVQRVADYLKKQIMKILLLILMVCPYVLPQLGVNSRNRSKVCALEVHRLRYLWARATSLLHKSGECLGLSMMIICLTNAASFVISVYGMIIGILEFNYEAVVHQGVNVVGGISYVFAGSESGYQSTQKMGDDITAALSAIDLSGINEVTSREINMFLQILSLNPPIVTCGGVITISRSLLTSIFSNTITYLIVLLQFKTSDIEFERNNETLASVLEKPEN